MHTPDDAPASEAARPGAPPREMTPETADAVNYALASLLGGSDDDSDDRPPPAAGASPALALRPPNVRLEPGVDFRAVKGKCAAELPAQFRPAFHEAAVGRGRRCAPEDYGDYGDDGAAAKLEELTSQVEEVQGEVSELREEVADLKVEVQEGFERVLSELDAIRITFADLCPRD